jgi:hypothetical protein
MFNNLESSMDTLMDLLSSCNIDIVSDCEIVKMVEYLNRDIKLLVLNIMDNTKTSGLVLRKPASNEIVNQESSRLMRLEQTLYEPKHFRRFQDPNCGIYILWRNLHINTHAFFPGRNFLRVGSDTLCDNSELLFSKLVACSALNLSLPALFLKIVLIYFYIYFIF